ncbi:acyltransferase family protein [Fulvivirga ligni]|uniref:acyltransferase family protein n=1 Tax=Fulvivirga ligni TaxID=2904246 RepID=UPI001F359695|nr:acyltransferase [Fulvivirga ligni]UII19319.1 acyltransferase [Fulvivirga ligni]
MRVEQLTFTRFLAAIFIVIFHFGENIDFFHNRYTSFLFENAYVFVSYFFVLSGFVMVVAYGNKSEIKFFSFLKKRLARIYPVYLLAIFLHLLIYLFQWTDTSSMVLNLLMLQSWVPEKAFAINFPAWSISVEFFFYFIFPFLVNFIYSKVEIKWLTVGICIYWAMSQIIFYLIESEYLHIPIYSTTDLYYFPVVHLNEFLIGNLMGYFFIQNRLTHSKGYHFQIMLLLTALLVILRFPMGLTLHTGLLAIILGLLILFLALSNSQWTDWLTHPALVFLGKISYSLYILQLPVWFIFSDHRLKKYFGLYDMEIATAFIIRLTALLLTAALTYLIFESPIRKLIRKL